MIRYRAVMICALVLASWSAAANAATLSFDIGNSGAPTAAGNITGSEFADFGVLVSSNKQLALFNSNCGPDDGNSCNSVGTDSDLATGPSFNSEREGNVLILNGGSSAAPNDDPSGGSFLFSFVSPVLFDGIRLLDLDENGVNNRLKFTFTFDDGAMSVFSGDGDLGGRQTLLNDPFNGDNSVRDFMFNLANVSQLEVEFDRISGAIASLDYTAPVPVPVPAALPLAMSGVVAFGMLAALRRRQSKAA